MVKGFQINSPGPLRLVGRTFSGSEEPQQVQQSSQLPGFHLLNWLLASHVRIPEVYFLLIGLMVGQSQPRTCNQVLRLPTSGPSHTVLPQSLTISWNWTPSGVVCLEYPVVLECPLLLWEVVVFPFIARRPSLSSSPWCGLS